MPFVTSCEMLKKAQAEGYAVGAFNVENMEMAQAVIWAAEETKSPVIVANSQSTLGYGSPAVFAAMVRTLAENSFVPVALHLDHGKSFDLTMSVLRGGFSSVMFDGSQLSLEDNIAATKRIVEIAHPMGVPVEGELGCIGGKADSIASDYDDLTDPEVAAQFVAATGLDSLAVAIGTQHGVYAKPPVLNVPRLKEIRARVDIPLVLHGASGLSDEAVRECIAGGISKINFATELRMAYTNAVRDFVAGDAKTFDPKKYGVKAREAVKFQVIYRIKVCGSCDKA